MQTKKLLIGIRNIVKKENLDCDFENQDAYVYAITDKELTNIKKELKAVKELDFPCQFEKELPLPIQNLRSNKISKSSYV